MKITLYSLSINARRLIAGFLVFAVIVLALDFIGKLFTSERSPFAATASTWEEVPLNVFGTNLPFPEIPSLAISKDVRPVYSLRNEFAIFPDTALLYQISKPREKLDSADKAKKVAEALGFDADSFKNENSLLTWLNPLGTRKLTHHLINRTWNLETVTYFQDPNAVRTKTTNKNNPNYPQLIVSAMAQLGFNTTNFTGGKTSVEFVVRTPTNFAPATFNQDAEYAVGNAFRKLLFSNIKPGKEYKDANQNIVKDYSALVYTAKPENGSISMVVADDVKDLDKDMYEFKFTDFEYSSNTSYYHLISPTLAWQSIQTGKGKLVSLIPQDKTRFDDYTTAEVDRFIAEATETELAYYEPTDWTGLIYPIYIFRGTAQLHTGGTASFVFYIDAMRR